MIHRKEYLKSLLSWKDEKVIKVITGIRRSGKSVLLEQYINCLFELGVDKSQITYINLEDLEVEELKDYKKLNKYIENNLLPDKMNYIFIDEVQQCEFFQSVVNSLNLKSNNDIYITGSNAYLLSGDLATLLSGRYVEISILPFSFKEYYEFNQEGDKEKTFIDFLIYGGFPYVSSIIKSGHKVDNYLEGIYNTIVLKDIEDRYKRKEMNPDMRKITDISLLQNIAKFLANSIGNLVTTKSVSNFITSSGRKVSENTINDYVNALVEPFIFYPVQRFDVNGKQILKSNKKLYIVDHGLRRYLVPKRNYDIGFTLENIIYLELIRRGYKVNVGKIGDKEIDFIAQKDNVFEYYQVSASVMDENTFIKEITPLKKIDDNYDKFIIVLDKFGLGNYEGIKLINAIDWLLE